ncbi:MAG: cobyrinate a,c-diamide synthase [candidate division Zixibacteria bacterium]|jgi:cobyrinic acid a,c-diamide synthase|nr:cobyrinate a,c-diamide synthase [candidate division Zixibacteria bacterium]
MRGTPRLLIAGLSGDTGKTIVSLSLLRALRSRGVKVAPFKKGPDYIDAAWLGWAADTACRNLDTFMVPAESVRQRFGASSTGRDLALIEGNRGLFDGQDLEGTHSSASLARLLAAPVILVVDATKATRTLAALVMGAMVFEPGVAIAGVILNRVAGTRHESIARATIEQGCGIPVLGALPKLGSGRALIPSRHLGLVPPTETDECAEIKTRLTELALHHLDLDALIEIAHRFDQPVNTAEPVSPARATCTIGVFRDSVFTFYYPENLEALEQAGARLVAIDSLTDQSLPVGLDGLYIGGGFPETQLDRLAGNRALMRSVHRAADSGLPVYAECGGLIYLARTLCRDDRTYQLAGVFDIDLTMQHKPCGHGYVDATVDVVNPFLAPGTRIRGHEFHYTGASGSMSTQTCLKIETGVGLGGGRDGLLKKNVMASYVHIHADGVSCWAPSFVNAAARYRQQRSSSTASTDSSPEEEPEPSVAKSLTM